MAKRHIAKPDLQVTYANERLGLMGGMLLAFLADTVGDGKGVWVVTDEPNDGYLRYRIWAQDPGLSHAVYFLDPMEAQVNHTHPNGTNTSTRALGRPDEGLKKLQVQPSG